MWLLTCRLPLPAEPARSARSCRPRASRAARVASCWPPRPACLLPAACVVLTLTHAAWKLRGCTSRQLEKVCHTPAALALPRAPLTRPPAVRLTRSGGLAFGLALLPPLSPRSRLRVLGWTCPRHRSREPLRTQAGSLSGKRCVLACTCRAGKSCGPEDAGSPRESFTGDPSSAARGSDLRPYRAPLVL